MESKSLTCHITASQELRDCEIVVSALPSAPAPHVRKRGHSRVLDLVPTRCPKKPCPKAMPCDTQVCSRSHFLLCANIINFCLSKTWLVRSRWSHMSPYSYEFTCLMLIFISVRLASCPSCSPDLNHLSDNSFQPV